MPLSRHHACCAASSRGAFALPGTGRQYERSLPYRFLQLALDLKVDLDGQRISGTATHQVRRTALEAEPLLLDAVALEVERVDVDSGKGFTAAKFTNDGRQLTVTMPDASTETTLTVRVTYECAPRRGLYFFKPDAKVDYPVQLWSQCQDEDARHWIPCHDKPHVKIPLSMRVTVPVGFDVLSNGNVIADVTRGKSRVVAFELSEVLPSYLITLVVGHFDKIRDRDAVLPSGRRVPVEYWVPKGKLADGRRAFEQTPRMIELFSRLTGFEYPYPRYTQVVVSEFIFGGMENTTATTMYEHILLDKRAAIDIESHDLVAHELAHQWFGDWVTCQDWPHAWLNEGFATFFELVELEDRLGEDEYFVAVERDHAAYAAEVSQRYSRPVVSREYSDPIDLFDRHLYQKGGLVLHLLRRELGNDVFWRGIKQYLSKHGGGTATTSALCETFTRLTGRSFERFFDEWILEPIHPAVKVKVGWEQEQVVVRFTQTQKHVMELAYEIEVLDKSGKRHHLRQLSSQAHTTLTLPLGERPVYVAVDPYFNLLGQTTIEVPYDLLQGQLEHGGNARVRRQACSLLTKHNDYRAVASFAGVLARKKEPWMVKAAAARALGKLRSAEGFAALVVASKDKEAKVRASVAYALGQFRTAESARALNAMLKGEASYLVEAAITRALGETREESAIPLLVKQLGKPSWGEVVASAAADALATLNATEQLTALLARTAYGVPTKARRGAILALGQFEPTQPILQRVEELLREPHLHVRLDAVSTAKRLGGTKALGLLRQALAEETDPRVKRKLQESLRDAEQEATTHALQERLTRLERQVEDLAAQNASAEALRKTAAAAATSSKRRGRR